MFLWKRKIITYFNYRRIQKIHIYGRQQNLSPSKKNIISRHSTASSLVCSPCFPLRNSLVMAGVRQGHPRAKDRAMTTLRLLVAVLASSVRRHGRHGRHGIAVPGEGIERSAICLRLIYVYSHYSHPQIDGNDGFLSGWCFGTSILFSHILGC